MKVKWGSFWACNLKVHQTRNEHKIISSYRNDVIVVNPTCTILSMVTFLGLNFNSSKAVWFYFANIITKRHDLRYLILVNKGKYPTFVDLEILNPTITVFNPTITAYLVPYITEGYDNKKMFNAIGWVYTSKSTMWFAYYAHFPLGLLKMA